MSLSRRELLQPVNLRFRGEQFLYPRDDLVWFNRRERTTAELEFHFPFGQRLFADANAYRKTHEIGILEFHAGPFVAIVYDHFDALRGEVRINFLSQLHY